MYPFLWVHVCVHLQRLQLKKGILGFSILIMLFSPSPLSALIWQKRFLPSAKSETTKPLGALILAPPHSYFMLEATSPLTDS